MSKFFGLATVAVLFGAGICAGQDCKTLAATVKGREDLSTLLDLVVSTGLDSELDEPEAELTVLAPNNDAFTATLDALGEEAAAALLEDTETLSSILTLHVIPGKFTSDDLSDGMVVETLAGIELLVSVSDEGVTFTPADCGPVATVLTPNFGSCKSTLHIIDTVLTEGTGCDDVDEDADEDADEAAEDAAAEDADEDAEDADEDEVVRSAPIGTAETSHTETSTTTSESHNSVSAKAAAISTSG